MNPADPFDKIPDHLKCPICMELPKGKVFQCRQGHSLCEKCYVQVTNCPQCRTPFEKEPIRTLLMEKMLDELNLECPFKNSGCRQAVDRTTFEDHIQFCSFNTNKYGPPVSVCKILGKKCEFKMNRGNVDESVQHYTSVHNALQLDLRSDSAKSLKFPNCTGNNYCVILNRKPDGYAILMLLNFASDKYSSLSWSSYYWRYPTTLANFTQPNAIFPFQLKFRLRGEHSLTWKISPMDVLKCEGQTETPPINARNIPVHEFIDKWDSNSLSLAVKVKRKKGLQKTL